MADTKISGLSAVTDVLATDEFVLARAGTTKKIDASDLGSALAGDPQVYRPCSNNAAGTMTQITNFTGFTVANQCHNPVLSPDGSKILFEITSATSGYREIWVVNATGGTGTQLVADGSNYVIHPFWAPDSDTFVYVRCAGGAAWPAAPSTRTRSPRRAARPR